MPETTPLIKAALNLRVGAGFDVYGDRTHALIYFLNVHIQNFAHVARFPFEKKDFQRLVRGNLFSKGVATGESWGAAAGGSITPNF